MVTNDLRTGNFTSSRIVALTSNGKTKGSYGVPFYSYLEEKKMERRLGRSLTEDVFAKPTSWGNLVEERVFRLLGEFYSPCSHKTIVHPSIDCWAGSPDATKENTVVDIKCPSTLKSFCLMVDAWKKGGINELRDKHKEGDTYYWQLVSNAILTGSAFAELIVYVPYQSELAAIKDLAQNFDGDKQTRFMWIALAYDDELPFVIDNGYYKNLNVMRFEIPLEDKDFLSERVLAAKELLFDTNILTQ